jgi:hypothetical protein
MQAVKRARPPELMWQRKQQRPEAERANKIQPSQRSVTFVGSANEVDILAR